jgi:MscS family membrane protein
MLLADGPAALIFRAMKWKFEAFFRGYVFLMFALLVWVFWASAQPATNAPASTETNAPAGANTNSFMDKFKAFEGNYLTFGLDRIEPLKTYHLFGEPLWKYVASLIYIFLAFYVSKLLDYLISVWLRKFAERTKSKLDDLLLEALRGPIKIVAFVIFLHVGLNVFRWPPAAQTFLSKGLIVVVAFSLTYVALKIVDLFLGIWRRRTVEGADQTFDDQLFPIVRKTVKVFIIVIAVLVTSQNLGINITAAIASLSIGGLAVGLAAQDTLANLFGAVAVFMDKPFRVGDTIRLDAVEGKVESIGLRSTRVRNVNGQLVSIPNKAVGNATITNITGRDRIKTEMNIGLTYNLPVEKLRRALQILDEIYGKNPMTAEVVINFNKFTDSALNILVVHWWKTTDNNAYLTGMQEMNLALKERFDKEGIIFAFPSQTVYLRQDSEWHVGDSQKRA